MKYSIRNFAFLLAFLFIFSCGEDNPTQPTPSKNPTINSIESNKVLSGDEMLIKGKDFGAIQGTSKVHFDNIIADTYLSWSDTEIKVIVPAIKSSGKVKVVTSEKNSNEVNYSLDDSPRILSVGNGRAYIGQEIEVKGLNFGNSNGKVTFNGVEAITISKWNDTLIMVTVPQNATTGDVIVKTSANQQSKGFFFTIAAAEDPFINMASPPQLTYGDELRIIGKNFGDTQGNSYVDFNGTKATQYTLWSKSEIKVKVPDGAKSGPVRVMVGQQGSNTFNLTITLGLPLPILSSISPEAFEANGIVTITGSNFGAMQSDSSYVFFNELAGSDYLVWESNLIKVTVPSKATSGTLTVRLGSLISNAKTYTINVSVKAPVITVINPTIAQVGQNIEIEGTSFGASKGSDAYVMFGTTKITNYTNWSDTKIDFDVPDVASGVVDIYVFANNMKSNTKQFTVQKKANAIVDLVLVKAGTFTMGCTDELADCYPQRTVTISKDYYVSETEVTQAAYKKVMYASNPSKDLDDKNPVEQVTWLKAVEFCNRLSELEGLQAVYTINGTKVTWDQNANGYRLLTEAEWEYAARAGSTGKFGNVGGSEAGISALGFTNLNASSVQHVRQLISNDFGLYDMHGNVAEWVWDIYDYYEEGAATDPTGPTEGPERVFRGGGYIDGPNYCTAYSRFSASNQVGQYYIGFRIGKNK